MWRWSLSPFPLKHESPEGAFIKVNKEISKEKIPFFNVVTRIISRLVWPDMWMWLQAVSHQGTGTLRPKPQWGEERGRVRTARLTPSCLDPLAAYAKNAPPGACFWWIMYLLTTFDLTCSPSRATSDKRKLQRPGSSWISILDFPAGGVDIATSLLSR